MSTDPVERLPQTGPSRLVVEALEVDGERTVCLARVPDASGLRHLGPRPGLLPRSAVIEMAAQSAAVAEPEVPSGDAPAGPRLLVGARELRLHGDSLPADRTYRVVTHRATHAPPFRSYRFELFDGEVLLAEGEISTYFDAP